MKFPLQPLALNLFGHRFKSSNKGSIGAIFQTSRHFLKASPLHFATLQPQTLQLTYFIRLFV